MDCSFWDINLRTTVQKGNLDLAQSLFLQVFLWLFFRPHAFPLIGTNRYRLLLLASETLI